MAGAGGTTPLRLKDLLELDCESCSAAGFRCYPRRLLGESAPTMRHHFDSLPSLRRRPSKLSHLSRSLSRRLGRGGLFWRRRDEGDEDDACAVAAPSGSGSESGASSSGTTTSDNSSGSRGSRCESDSDFSTATTSSASDSMDADAADAVNDTTGDEHQAMKRGSSSGAEADDKEEQLSPVAVMDFPFDDDEGEDGDEDGERDVAGACSPSFSLSRLQRRKMLRPQHKIRRLGSTQELGPMDLEALLAATSDTDDLADDVLAQQVIQCRTEDVAAAAPRPTRSHRGASVVCHEPDEHDLLHLLMDAASAGVDHVSERLLFDFFVEMKRRRGSTEHPEKLSAPAVRLLPRMAERLGDDGEVLAAARGWMDGAGSERWGLNDVLHGGEAIVAEMERGRRWMQVREEEQEISAVVAGMLADQLVDELVWDLFV
ncbi:hypothetical protein SEVIR_9G353700v4 [Setaria viridis]|uniref:DUF4378 domain-containing protein n=1 Tax=Setaria viridis TaxID=4556 RepID=A0A4U6T2N9_SETVI|nr:uncharacterized protein LOC117836655 [Setaria viridis]TKV95291.1 hypothetical protein SEVIR_9G353700v2 [Setaria viridis]